MAARRLRYLSEEEILQLLHDLPDDDSDAEEQQDIDLDTNNGTSVNFETENVSTDSESDKSINEESSSQNIQPVNIPVTNSAQPISVASTSSKIGFSDGKKSKKKLDQNHEVGHIYVSKDGTSWTVSSTSQTAVIKYGAQNVVKEKSGPTPYAKRNVGDNVSSAWRLFIDDSMLRHIKKCTDAEAELKNEENWTLSLEEIYLQR